MVQSNMTTIKHYKLVISRHPCNIKPELPDDDQANTWLYTKVTFRWKLRSLFQLQKQSLHMIIQRHTVDSIPNYLNPRTLVKDTQSENQPCIPKTDNKIVPNISNEMNEISAQCPFNQSLPRCQQIYVSIFHVHFRI